VAAAVAATSNAPVAEVAVRDLTDKEEGPELPPGLLSATD